MDDPWGSPWAEELHQPVPAPNSKGENGLTLAPTIAQGEDAVTTEKTNSLWDVPGDAYGSWSDALGDQKIREDGGISSVSPEWGAQGAGHSKKIDTSGLSPNWDESQAGSGLSTPKLSPGPLPNPTELIRQASPDPWATTVAVSPSVDLKDIPEVGGQDIKPGLENAAVSNTSRDPHMEQHEESLHKITNKPLEESRGGAITIEAAPEGDPKEAERTAEVPDKDLTDNIVDDLSRSPSSPSDLSPHDETHLESPRTSLDEDSHRPEPQRHVSEKIQVLVEHYDALAKAHLEEPVIIERDPASDKGEDDEEEQYNEQTFLPEVNPGDSLKNEAELNEEDEEDEKEAEVEEEADDDFGDFEDGHSQISNSIGEEEQAADDTKNEIPDDKILRVQEEKTSPTPSIASVRTPVKSFGRVKYIVDMPALDTLYPGLKSESIPPHPVEKPYIPDTIPHDSFTSVEERKMWYRLSRYTTLRQHTSGEDDNNYIRVSWAGSRIREETLKVAGKWMEQDRISGRVVLGGDSKDGSLFGWNDPKAAPMPLATAFAMSRGKKKSNIATNAAADTAGSEAPKEPPRGHVDSRPSSQPSQKQRRRSSTKVSRTSEEAKQRLQQPVASFGWSSEQQPAAPVSGLNPKPIPSNPIPSSQNPPASSHLQPTSGTVAPVTSTLQIPSSLDGWDAPQPIINASTHPQIASDTVAPVGPTQHMPSSFNGWNASPVKISANTMPSPTIEQNSSNDFNDDWGDMISSPAIVTSPPQIPPLRGLSHKKSQSLIGTSLPTTQATSGVSEAPQIRLGNSHRPTSSLDGISIPQMQIPATTPALSTPFSINASISNSFTTSTDNATSIASSTYDPWAAADFSVFEAPTPPPKPKSAPPPKPSAQRLNRGVKSVSFESTRAIPEQRNNGKTREEVEQQRTVARIVRGLPNLSYMLRR